MEVVLDAMADGGVMTGIPHSLALRMSAYTMIVSPVCCHDVHKKWSSVVVTCLTEI